MLQRSELLTPLLASLVLLPWLWALPNLHHMPLQLQWSGRPQWLATWSDDLYLHQPETDKQR